METKNYYSDFEAGAAESRGKEIYFKSRLCYCSLNRNCERGQVRGRRCTWTHSFNNVYIEIKNIVTIASGEWGGVVGRGVYRSYYKGHRTKSRGRVEVGEGGGTRLDGVGWREGEKMQTIVTE